MNKDKPQRIQAQRMAFIAGNNKTHSHYLFTIIRSDYCSGCSLLNTTDLNTLINWKTVDDLIGIASYYGPFIGYEIFNDARRIITIDEAISIARSNGRGEASKGFCRVNAQSLQQELLFDSRNISQPTIEAIRKDAEKHGLFERQATGYFELIAREDEKARVVIEPIEDIVFIKNLCTIITRLIANYQNENIAEVLAASGFIHSYPDHKNQAIPPLPNFYYCIRLMKREDIDPDAACTWIDNDPIQASKVIYPLFQKINEEQPKACEDSFGSIDNAITCSSTPLSGLAGVNNSSWIQFASLYLGLKDENGERAAVEQFITGLANMVGNLKNEQGDPLGWDIQPFPVLSDNGRPIPLFFTLFSAMLGSILTREGMKPATCKYCGNGLLSRSKGKPKEFCSDSCRSLYAINKGTKNDKGTAQ